MKRSFQGAVENYTKDHRRRKRRHRVAAFLAAGVVLCTSYAMILPAITAENLQCGLPEHTHGEACYTQVTTVSQNIPVCAPIHRHFEECYNAEGEISCGYACFVVHTHGEICYDPEGNLLCTLPEIEAHTHTEDCYVADGELTCDQAEILLHKHIPECYDGDGIRICGQPEVLEHRHTEECFEMVEEPADTETLTCTLPEDETHTHTALCYGTWVLTCGLEEHLHSDACRREILTEEEQIRVGDVKSRIDALPTLDEITEKADALDVSGNEEDYEAYLTEISLQVRWVYAQYEDLGAELQEQVTNRDKLLNLAYLWEADTLSVQNTLSVYQINTYTQAVTTLVSGGSIKAILGSGMRYTYWDALIIEEDAGKLYVSQYITEDISKLDCMAESENGFVLLLYNTQVNAAVGDIVTVDFDYKQSGAYSAAGYGTVTFASGMTANPKPEKDNSEKLTVVPSSDTLELIEINLYDYGSGINAKHSENVKYPGFQQFGGMTASGVSTIASSNFGDNITTDWVSNPPRITNQGGAINTTNSISGINRPIGGDDPNAITSGAMLNTLGADGHPALADGTSLGYLFTNSGYATKKNTQNINGLFQYDPNTGYYTFDSRHNHAQFNEATNTFTLYDQLITSNFTMYPFGNFLPFNDIVTQCAQVSTIDRDYLAMISASAGYQANQGEGEQYTILANALNAWIGKMDAAYPEGWGASDAINAYFNANVGNQNFDFAAETELLENVYSIDYDEPTNFFFGMEMKLKIMQPKGGRTQSQTGSEPMRFYFTGDDDVWVYVDGVLFLDLSGIHRHVGGIIDFEKGQVCYYALDPNTGDVDLASPYKTVTFEALLDAAYGEGNDYSAGLVPSGANGEYKTFGDYSVHSFNFYYMERGAGSGVCRMNFNFPVLKKNSISVKKELSVNQEEKVDLLGDPDFRFQILKENALELFIGADTTYDILDESGVYLAQGKTDDNGVFTLKAGQTAVFTGISENSGKYFVRELLTPDAFAQFGTIQVDGTSQTRTEDNILVGSDEFVGVNSPVKDISEGSTVFYFNNQVDFYKLGTLQITKRLEAYQNALSTRQFQFYVTLDGRALPVGTAYQVGEETRTVQEAGKIFLSPDETAVISGILADSRFTVEELASSAEGYYVGYCVDGVEAANSASGIIQTDSTVSVIVTNSEIGASVSIPVQKVLELPDGETHHYTLALTQVTDPSGETLVQSGLTQALTVDITDTQVYGEFTLNYVQASLETNPAVFYYRIAETQQAEEEKTLFDSAGYVVEVTVSYDRESCHAEITSVWKDGQKVEDGDIVFVNQLIHYELPATGGAGTISYTIGGFLLTFAAGLLLLYSFTKHKRGEVSSS